MRRHNLLAGLIVGLLACTGVQADDDAEPDYAADTLSGDWGGRRSEWFRQGLSLDLSAKSDWLRNRGGLGRGGRPMNHLDIRAKADLDKLWGWKSATAYINLLDDWGDKLNGRYTGSLMGASNIEVPVNTTRFFHAWLEKGLFDDRLAVLVGLYPVDSEFSVVDSAGLFLHPAYGASADFSPTRGPSIFNNSAFGTRLKWISASRKLYVQGALLDGIPGDPQRPRGTHIKFAKGDGSFHIAEIGYLPGDGLEVDSPAKDAAERAEAMSEHFAKFAAGFWGYTARVDDLVAVDAAGNPERRKSRGWYALAEKTVWADGADRNRNLTLFGRYSATDGDSTPIRRALNLGVRLRGLLASRPDDLLGLAATRGELADKYRQVQRAAGVDASANEAAIELSYRAAIRNWLSLQPSLQRIRYPGGDRSLPAATVFGARIEVVF